MSGDLTRRLAWIGSLTAVWVLLNGELNLANLIGGLLVAVGVLVVAPVAATPRRHRVHPVAAVRFLVFVAWSLVTSSIAVVVTSLWPTEARLRAGIVRVELPGASPLVTTLVANAITLTPGTLTVTAEADPGVLHVHALGLGDLDEFRAEIADLHARAIALDIITAALVSALAVAIVVTGDGIYADAILVLGLLSFLATVAIARFMERRGA